MYNNCPFFVNCRFQSLPIRWLAIMYISIFCYAFGISQADPLHKEIDKIIQYETDISNKNIPAWIIGIYVDGQELYYTYGKSADSLLHENTIFEVGGVTKVFTTVLTKILVQKGHIHLDSSVNYYLPVEYRNAAMREITLHHLILHTSGLPRLPIGFGRKEKDIYNPYKYYTKQDLLQFYHAFRPVKDRPEYLYAHVNFALLEVIIELATQKKFISLLDSLVLQPLELENSYLHMPHVARENFIVGHSISGNAMRPWQFQSFAGSEGLKTSAADLLKLMRYSMRSPEHALSSILEEMTEPQQATQMVKNTYAGEGWHMYVPKRYYPVRAHTGNTSGCRAFTGFVKESKTAVVVLSNSVERMDGLGFKILQMINHNWRMPKTKKRGKKEK